MEDAEVMIQTLRDSNSETLYCKKVGGVYEVKVIKLPQEHLWLVLLKLKVAAGFVVIG